MYNGRRAVFMGLAVAMLVSSCGRLNSSNPASDAWPGVGDLQPSSFVLHDSIFQMSSPTAFTQTAVPLAPNSGSIAAPLSAGTSPVAELAADGKTLVFSTWRYLVAPPTADSAPFQTGTQVAHPAIHALDLQTGVDRVFADGSISPVLSSSGDVAFVKGDRADYYANEPFMGTIQVQALGSEVGTTLVAKRDNYRLVGWANQTLLYYVQSEGEVLDLFAVSSGGSPHLLAEGAGVVAVSPDGLSVLVQRLGTVDSEVALVDVAEGTLLQHTSDLAAPDGTPVGALQLKGDWLGSRVVAAAVTFAGIAYLRIGEDSIVVDSIRDLGHSDLPMGVEAPRFSPDGSSVTAYAVIPPDTASGTPHAEVVTCSDSSSSCAFVAPEPTQPGAAYPIVRAS
jgi:hypothetical protein